MGCPGLHCDGCRGSGGSVLMIMGGAGLLAALGGSTAFADTVTTVIIVIACIVVLAVLGLLGLLVWRVRSEFRPRLTNLPDAGITRAEVIEHGREVPARYSLRVPERDARALAPADGPSVRSDDSVRVRVPRKWHG